MLGAVALIRWRIPRRAAWALAFLAGIFLALGRHNPLYEALREAVPVLAVLRFPEKFAVLAVLALVFAGASAGSGCSTSGRRGARRRPTCRWRWRGWRSSPP